MSLKWFTWDTWKKRGIRGHPQDYDLATSGPLLLPHHIMLLISIKEIFSSPWYSNAYKIVSSPNKWYDNFYQDGNYRNHWETILFKKLTYIKKGNTLFILFYCRKSFNDIDFAMVPLAWTTHAQGRPQLLHCSSFSFTLHSLFLFLLRLIK